MKLSLSEPGRNVQFTAREVELQMTEASKRSVRTAVRCGRDATKMPTIPVPADTSWRKQGWPK